MPRVGTGETTKQKWHMAVERPEAAARHSRGRPQAGAEPGRGWALRSLVVWQGEVVTFSRFCPHQTLELEKVI